MQTKCRISKKKDESNEPLRLKQYKQRAKYNALVRALHLHKQPPTAVEVNTANELRPGTGPGVH